MSVTAARYLRRFGARALRSPLHPLLRTATSEPSPPKGEACGAPAARNVACPEPPPCPSMPHCPSTICPTVADPNNPCNYCPPPCIDPHYPDLTKLKKLQCLFQEEDDVPIYLKKGNVDAFIYQLTLVLIIITLVIPLVSLFKAK